MSKCVLIVDDDRTVIELARRTLEDKGYAIMTAKNGQEALETLKGKVPDVILLDVQMPDMDGYEFILKKSTDPQLAVIPVVVLSAMEKTEPLFKRHGVKAYLLKPINTKDLLDTIQSIAPL